MANREEFGLDERVEDVAKWLAEPRTSDPPGYYIAARPQSGPQVSFPEAGSLILPGSFNPLHAGHLEIARIAEANFTGPCWFEISTNNVDKQPLAVSQLESRLRQAFRPHGVVVTKTATFVQKSALFPGSMFIVGADTIVRFADLRYHHDDPQQLHSAIEIIAANRCRFIVFGRMIANKFVDRQNISLGAELQAMCTFVNREQFSMDISSTGLRADNDINSSEGS